MDLNALKTEIHAANARVRLIKKYRKELEEMQAVRDDCHKAFGIRNKELRCSKGTAHVNTASWGKAASLSFCIQSLSMKDVTKALRIAAKHGFRQNLSEEPYESKIDHYREIKLHHKQLDRVGMSITFSFPGGEGASCEYIEDGYEAPQVKYKMLCGDELAKYRTVKNAKAS